MPSGRLAVCTITRSVALNLTWTSSAAPNKDGAYAYMDAMLEAKAQENFAIDMAYNPTVSNATVADDLKKRIGFTADEVKRLKDIDYAFLAKNDAAMKEWWDKSFKS